MSKRFTDSEKWKKPFIKGLNTLEKVIWFYVLDECDHAGIFEVEHEVMEARLKEKIDLQAFLKKAGDKIKVFENGRKWFIQDFVDFQYGELNENNRLHHSVLQRLFKYSLIKNKPLISPFQGAKDKNKDKDKDKEKGDWFDEIWTSYPNKDGKRDALRHFRCSVRTEADFQRIKQALANYQKHLSLPQNSWKQPKQGKTWFNNWQDWENWSEPERRETDAERSERLLARLKP